MPHTEIAFDVYEVMALTVCDGMMTGGADSLNSTRGRKFGVEFRVWNFLVELATPSHHR